MQVTVPEGVLPGQMVQVQAPSGQMVQVQVPAGLQPGQPLQIQMPASGQTNGDRVKEQDGMTKLDGPPFDIKVSSWEISPPDICEKFALALRCSNDGRKRSYLYIRSNCSIEANDTTGWKTWCTWCGFPHQDHIRVEYFDRRPYEEECHCAPFPFCCFWGHSIPKLEVLDHGCMCCCVKIKPCCSANDEEVVVVPYETNVCCSNRTNACDNCFGLCGPLSGMPKHYYPFSPQPENVQAFVEAAKKALASARGASLAKEGAPGTDEMIRDGD